MNALRIFTIALAVANLPSFSAHARTYELTFFEHIPYSTQQNIFTDYDLAGSGSFEIADYAITPNNLVLFTDPAFEAFDLALDTQYGSGQFTLGVDVLPGEHDYAVTGILFDDNAEPLRFDDPTSYVSSVGTYMCDPDCDPRSRENLLWLQDNNIFSLGYLADGSIVSYPTLDPGTPYTRLAGTWSFFDTQVSVQTRGYFQITPVPVPAAAWLFATGLLGLLGFNFRTKKGPAETC